MRKTAEELLDEVRDRVGGWDARFKGYLWRLAAFTDQQIEIIGYLSGTGSLVHKRTRVPAGMPVIKQLETDLLDLVLHDPGFKDYLLQKQEERLGAEITEEDPDEHEWIRVRFADGIEATYTRTRD